MDGFCHTDFCLHHLRSLTGPTDNPRGPLERQTGLSFLCSRARGSCVTLETSVVSSTSDILWLGEAKKKALGEGRLRGGGFCHWHQGINMRWRRQTVKVRSGDQERANRDIWLAVAARTNYLVITWLEHLMGAREMVQPVKTLVIQVWEPELKPKSLHKNTQAWHACNPRPEEEVGSLGLVN